MLQIENINVFIRNKKQTCSTYKQDEVLNYKMKL